MSERRTTEKQRYIESQRAKAKRIKRQEAGLCTKCGKPLDREGTQCQECHDRMSEHYHARRDKLLELGICPICGMNDIFGDEKSCPMCKAKRALWKADHREENAEYKRNLYASRIEKGLCPMCGKNPVNEGYKSCSACREHRRQEYAKKEKPYVRNEWSAERKCVLCGSDDLAPNKRICKLCYSKRLAAVKKTHEKTPDRRGHIWNKTNPQIRGKYRTTYDKFGYKS